MAKTREIKSRMKAVGNIQRITRTMQMIATARFNAAQRHATDSRPYAEKIRELVGQVAAAVGAEPGSFDHPLLRAPDPSPGRRLLLVLTSDRGLCGGYNANILRKARGELGGDEPTRLEVVGSKGQSYFRFAGYEIAAFYQFGDRPAYADVEQLAERYIREFEAGHYDRIDVVYMAFHSAARQTATARTLLPLESPSADASAGASAGFEFEPSAERLLTRLLPATVKTQLYQWFNEAVVSEHVARMVAMKGATDAASEMRENLNREYNRARQAAITTELSEIIGGAAALE